MTHEAQPRRPVRSLVERTRDLYLQRQANLWKQDSVLVATTANITLSGRQTVDGVALISGDRVLVKNQTLAQYNGIYECRDYAWFLTTDSDHSDKLQAGTTVYVRRGSTNANTVWRLTTEGVTIDQFGGATPVTSQVWVDYSAYDRARANHTGTQTASTISDFNTAVRTNRLDQMATPTSTVQMGGQFVSNVGTPFFGTDAANKTYADSLVATSALKYYRFAQSSGNPIATVVSTNTLTQLVSIATPAALAGDELVFYLAGDHLNNAASGNQTFALNMTIGGTTMFNLTTAAQGAGSARGKWVLVVHTKVEAIGGAPVIITSGYMHVFATNNAANWGSPGTFAGMLRASVDLTSASTLVLNVTPSINNSLLDWRLLDYSAHRVRT